MKDIVYVGVNDHNVDLFEGIYKVPNGMSYNSYVIFDEKITVMDTVDERFGEEWLKNIEKVLGDKAPSYLVVQHMEPDHSSNIKKFLDKYKNVTVVSSKKAFNIMKNYFESDYSDRRLVVKEGDTLSLGKHTLHFVEAQMVHWPEVIMTYDETEKVLFSADAFGKFGALDSDQAWDDEARRYYIGIVGRFGVQVQNVLKKAKLLDIQTICPLHGPILENNLAHYINLYDIWSSYKVESEGVLIAYTSVYGHTKEAVMYLAAELKKRGCANVVVEDLAREDQAKCVANAFKFGKVVLATTTYNAELFPFMRDYLVHLVERQWKNRFVGIIGNGSWAPTVERTIMKVLEPCESIKYAKNNVTIFASMKEENKRQIEALANELL